MLQNSVCRELLHEKKFNDLYIYFENEYKNILDYLLKCKGIDSTDLNYTKTILVATSNYVEIFDLLLLIAEISFDMQRGLFNRIDMLIELYKPLKLFYDSVETQNVT